MQVQFEIVGTATIKAPDIDAFDPKDIEEYEIADYLDDHITVRIKGAEDVEYYIDRAYHL